MRASIALLPLFVAACAAHAPTESASANDLTEASDHYYLAMFGYEDPGHHPETSHTFAAFLHVSQTSEGAGTLVEERDISWIPARFQPVLCVGFPAGQGDCAPEPGKNYTVAETIADVEDANANLGLDLGVHMWGPYEINAATWAAAGAQANRLDHAAERGQDPKWIAVDFGHRNAILPGRRAENCIHAVTDVVGFEYTDAKFGFDASEFALGSFGFGASSPTADWVADAFLRLSPTVQRNVW